VKSGEPHGYQKDFIQLAESVLKDLQTRISATLGELDVAQKEAETSLGSLQAAQEEASKAADTAKEAVATQKSELSELEKANTDAESKHKRGERDASAMVKAWDEVKGNHQRFGAIIEGSLRMLVDGGWEDDELMGEALKAVEDVLKEINADASMSAGAAHALSTKPDARHPFDKLVVDAINATLTKHAEGLEAKVQASAPEEAAKRAEVLGLWAIADCARDTVASAKRKLSALEASKMDALAVLELEKEKVTKVEADVAERANKRARAQDKAQETSDALEAIGRLVAGPVAPSPAPAARAEQGADASVEAA